jgi:large subunit ribosomal protein L33
MQASAVPLRVAAKQTGAGMPRDIITLQCTETKLRLYTTTKNKKKTTEKLELKKYNNVLRRHTVFRETK